MEHSGNWCIGPRQGERCSTQTSRGARRWTNRSAKDGRRQRTSFTRRRRFCPSGHRNRSQPVCPSSTHLLPSVVWPNGALQVVTAIGLAIEPVVRRVYAIGHRPRVNHGIDTQILPRVLALPAECAELRKGQNTREKKSARKNLCSDKRRFLQIFVLFWKLRSLLDLLWRKFPWKVEIRRRRIIIYLLKKYKSTTQSMISSKLGVTNGKKRNRVRNWSSDFSDL